MTNPVANNNLPATNKDENAPEPQHVLSIYDVYENLFRHYSAEELEYSLEELLEDMTVQAEEKGKLAVEHATEPPQNAGPSGKTVIISVLNDRDAAKVAVNTFLRKISKTAQISAEGVHEEDVIITPVEREQAIIFDLWYPAPPRFDSESNNSFIADVHGIRVSLLPAITNKDAQASIDRPVLILYPVPPFSGTNFEDLNMISTDVREFQLHLEEEHSKRAKRLLKNMYYVFVDLHYQLANAAWEDNVRAMQNGYAYTAKQTGKRALIAISRVHLLHRRIGEIYRLRGLRTIHSEALDCFLDLVPRISGTAGASHGIWEEEEKQNIPKETGHEQDEGRGLKARLLSIGKELNYHEQNLVNLHERFRNLIDLEFNIQSTITNQNIEAITYLAFLFAPLSFVAACFGVNGIQAPHWFWVTCLPVLAAGIICAFFMRPTVSFFARLESHIHGLVLDHQEQGSFERWISEKVKRRRNRGSVDV